MKKRFIFSLLAIFLAAIGFGGVSLAVDTTPVSCDSAVAKIGELCYATLQSACDSATNENHVIVLQKNIEGADVSYYGGNRVWLDSDTPADEFVFDLNGYTISFVTGHDINVFDKKLTVKDSSDSAGGTIHSTAFQIFNLYEGASLEIENGTISADGDYAVAVRDNAGIYVKGGSVVANGPVISGNGSGCPEGSCVYGGTDMKIEGGIVKSLGDYAIYHPSTAKLTITGDAYVEGWAGAVIMNCGDLEINGGTLKTLGNDMAGQIVSNGTDGHKASVIDVLSLYCTTTTVINGGNFVAEGNAPIIWTGEGADYGTTETSKGYSVEIGGGKFSAQPDREYIKDGYVAKEITESPYLYEVGIATYTITWNFKTSAGADTSDTTEVNHGVTPEYTVEGYTLNNRIYTFNSWTPTPVAAIEDAGYTATYTTGACAEGYDDIEGECLNKQTVACTTPSSTVANATYAITTEITYSGGARTEAGECTFTCNAGYRLSNGQCVKKSSSSSSSSTTTTTGATTESGTTVESGATAETGTTVDTGADTPTVDPQAVQGNGYTNEMNEAYDFAYANGITTMKTIEEAAMEEGLTRIAMAKMLSQYAINVLKKTPDTSKECKFGDVSAELDAEYANGVTLACQLGIMGVGITDFRPNDPVIRAEFGTALSRLLFGLADGEEAYYTTHLAKLKEAGIIKNDDPTLEELRGYVMLMLMRSAAKK